MKVARKVGRMVEKKGVQMVGMTVDQKEFQLVVKMVVHWVRKKVARLVDNLAVPLVEQKVA